MPFARFGVILGLLIALGLPTVQAYDIVGDYVIEDNSDIYMSAYPHTITQPNETVYFVMTNRRFTGMTDIVFGFDTNIIYPRGGDYYNGTDWNDVTGKFTRKDKDYQGMDRWYYTSFNMEKDQDYYMRIQMELNGTGDGKYWVCMKRTEDTFQEAIASGNYYCMDPWFDFDFIFKREITAQCSDCTRDVELMIPVNGTSGINISDIIQYLWCNLTVTNVSSTVGFLYYNDNTDYVCANSAETANVTTIVDIGNDTSFGTPETNIMAWYMCTDPDLLVDTGIYNRNGTANGNPTQAAGQFGKAIDCDGTGDFYNLSADFFETAVTEGAVTFWLNLDAFSTIPLGKGANASNLLRMVEIDGGGKLALSSVVGGSTRIAGNSGSLEMGTGIWTFISIVWNTSEAVGTDGIKYYINGTKSGDATVSPWTSPLVGGFNGQFQVCANGTGGTNMNGRIDNLRFWNRTLSDDDIAAMYAVGTGTIGAQLINFTVSITSPADGGAFTEDNNPINLTWQFDDTNQTPCDTSFYSLNSAANVSTSCANTTITLTAASNTLVIWANNTDGGMASDSSTFTFIANTYNISVFDEIDGTIFNTSDMVMTFFCANDTQTFDFGNESTGGIDVTCITITAKLTITDNSSNVNTRSLRPDDSIANLSFYMINESRSTKKTQTWRIYDITGLYENGIVVLEKIIPDLGQTIMTEETIDAEDKVVLDLIVGELYIISIFDSDGGNERSIGIIEASTDDSINLQVSDIPFATEGREPARDVFITWFWDADLRIIRVIYNDTLAQTTSVNFTVYNASNISIINFTALSTSDVVTFTMSGVDINSSYTAYITAQHDRYGQIQDSVNILFGDTGQLRVSGLDELGLGIWMSVAGGMIALFVGLSFGRRSSKIGSAVTVLIIIMFMSFGWFSDSPQLGWSMVIMIAFIAFVGLLSLRRRFN